MGYRFEGEDCAEARKNGANVNRKTNREFRMAEMLAQRIPALSTADSAAAATRDSALQA